MSDYSIKYTRKRLFRKLFKKVDVWELYGPVKHHYPDSTHGNGGSSDIKIVTSKLEEFLDEDEAYDVMERYREYETKNT